MTSGSSASPTVEALRHALTRVLDPEVGMNIVDLGLVYEIRVGSGHVEVDITMTTPSCPMGSMIQDETRDVVREASPPGTRVAVNLVWDPPWDPSKMSDRAREHFGWQ
jgi:metal-sulfur cluster biosynthetic enzyme